MPALKTCSEPGCPELTERGRCPKHKSKQRDDRRESARSRGYTRQWEALREEHLRLEPHCRECRAEGTLRFGSHVDHIVPHRGDPELFWDRKNLQTLCPSHHSTKTRQEAGLDADELRARYAPDAQTLAAMRRRERGQRRGWLGA